MKFRILLIFALLGVCVGAAAQVEFTSGSYFPADLEFRELQKLLSEESFDDPARLSGIEDGKLILDVGFHKYARRTYSLGGAQELSIEIVGLKDTRAAYSLITLLRSSSILDGPPGDACTVAPGMIRISKDRHWIRIRALGAPDDLLKRIAISISNRIGLPQQTPPALISHLPEAGYDASSLRYFPAVAAFESFSGAAAAKSLNLIEDAEIAQAQYTVDNHPGVLFLMNFPTGQVAENYFDALGTGVSSETSSDASYAKRVGPIVAIFKGRIEPASANKFLDSLRYSYSIRWIYEKKNQTNIIWGIPVKILGTVVRSLFFIAILGVVSIVAGAGFAFLRFGLRKRFSRNAPDLPEDGGIIRLRLR